MPVLKRSKDLTRPTTRAVGLPPKRTAAEDDSPAQVAVNMQSVAMPSEDADAELLLAVLAGTANWSGRCDERANAALRRGR